MGIVGLIAAVVIAWLVFAWLFNIIKTSLGTAFKIALIVLLLQLFFGIGPQQLWKQVQLLPQLLQESSTPTNSAPN
ncbi:MAG: hypothetical protein AAGG02_01930 [Cyanobacteria bacterium P01_H01_bin.15]